MPSTYDPAKHDAPLVCPDCTAENAPAETDEYDGVCHDCGFIFDTPVSPGDTVTVEVNDIHESGRGVGRVESGFVILVSGVLPPSDNDVVKEAEVTINRVLDNYAEADKVHETRIVEIEDEDDEEADVDEEDEESSEEHEEDEEDSGPALGRREDFWGSD